jgi:hypothetical protein
METGIGLAQSLLIRIMRSFPMTTLEKIQAEIKALPSEEYIILRKWFLERDWERWDTQLEDDINAGKLDFLVEEASEEKSKQLLKEL